MNKTGSHNGTPSDDSLNRKKRDIRLAKKYIAFQQRTYGLVRLTIMISPAIIFFLMSKPFKAAPLFCSLLLPLAVVAFFIAASMSILILIRSSRGTSKEGE